MTAGKVECGLVLGHCGHFDHLIFGYTGKGLEFSRDSISWRNVNKDSFVKNLSRTLTFSTCLADWMRDSPALPIHGLTRELKICAVWQWLTNCLFTFDQDF